MRRRSNNRGWSERVIRGMDHLVVPTRDLAGLVQAFRDLGFQVGGRNRHPWGTENHIIQFSSSFVELLGFAENFAVPSESEPSYPFAGFLHEWVAEHRHGSAMAVLHSTDAKADAIAFRRQGIGSGRMLPFSRSAIGPDGTDRTVAFTIAFAEPTAMPQIGFFTCEQHRPENFWNPAAQVHANGVANLTGFVIVAESPLDHAGFLSTFAGHADPLITADGVTIALQGGCVEILTPVNYARRYVGSLPIAEGGPRIAAMLFSTHALDRLSASATAAGLAAERRADRIVLHVPALGSCALVVQEG